MASSINKVFLSGRAGSEPRVNTLSDGTKVCDFSLATGGEKWTTKEGREVEVPTQWHNIVCWRSDASFAEKAIRKGVGVTVLGELSYRKYTDKSGVERYATDIVAIELFIGGESKGNGARPSDMSQYAQPTGAAYSTHQPFPQDVQERAVEGERTELPF